MACQVPPIVKLAERVLLEIERAVLVFPRRHKYLIGSDLRRGAMAVTRKAHRAWSAPAPEKKARVGKLLRAIDALKYTMQLGVAIKAFRSFAQFEVIARIADDLASQAGGWNRHLQKHPNGQNRGGMPPARAEILSTHAAPRRTGANT